MHGANGILPTNGSIAEQSGVNGTHGSDTNPMINESRAALEQLLEQAGDQIPQELLSIISEAEFTTTNTGSPYFPCPFKQTEAISALKAVEAGLASAIANLEYGDHKRRSVVDLERASCFLFSAYLCTIAGMNKGHPKVKSVLKDTDLLQAQSNTYRRLSANLYQTKNAGEYFHIHGSLEATTTLNMIGLEGHRPDMTDYHECIKLIGNHVKQFTAEQLEAMNAERRQAGVSCLKWDDFRKTKHGQTLLAEPPWRLEPLENTTPPAGFSPITSQTTPKPQILAGIKVLELCRIIAGPSIGKGLAEYGASVMKVTSPHLSDVPFFQVDGNLGKHCVDLNLKTPEDRATFSQLLEDADVVLDGYRPGSLKRLGYGQEVLKALAEKRGKGIVYVAEDCFGHVGESAGRPGWQQIADCVSGVAWAQGIFMGLNEPVIPPFPMSDYGTGCMGTIAALTGLYRRAKEGGSWWGTTSLVQYDIYLLRLSLYPKNVQSRLRWEHDEEFFGLRHCDSVDEVGKRALKSMKRVHPELFADELMQTGWSKAYGQEIKFIKPVVTVDGTWNGWVRCSRPNGADKADQGWEGWEVDDEMVKE